MESVTRGERGRQGGRRQRGIERERKARSGRGERLDYIDKDNKALPNPWAKGETKLDRASVRSKTMSSL